MRRIRPTIDARSNRARFSPFTVRVVIPKCQQFFVTLLQRLEPRQPFIDSDLRHGTTLVATYREMLDAALKQLNEHGEVVPDLLTGDTAMRQLIVESAQPRAEARLTIDPVESLSQFDTTWRPDAASPVSNGGSPA